MKLELEFINNNMDDVISTSGFLCAYGDKGNGTGKYLGVSDGSNFRNYGDTGFITSGYPVFCGLDGKNSMFGNETTNIYNLNGNSVSEFSVNSYYHAMYVTDHWEYYECNDPSHRAETLGR